MGRTNARPMTGSATNPKISRFRVRCFAPPRNDRVKRRPAKPAAPFSLGPLSPPDLGSASLELERDVQLGAVGLYLALGIQLQVELDHFGNPKIPQRFSGAADGRRGSLFPGFLAGADQLDDLVDALSHVVLPFDVRQDAGAPAANERSIAISALKGASPRASRRRSGSVGTPGDEISCVTLRRISKPGRRPQFILGGVEKRMVRRPGVGLRHCVRAVADRACGCRVVRGRTTARLAAGGNWLADEFDLVEGNRDEVHTDAEETADSKHHRLDVPALVHQEVVDRAKFLV